MKILFSQALSYFLIAISGMAPLLFKSLKNLWIKEGWEVPNKINWGIKLTELITPSLTLLNDGIDQSRIFFEEPSLKEDAIQQLSIQNSKDCLNIIFNPNCQFYLAFD